uniref:ATP-dependent DNA helicase n=1 Tax=Prevotella sp. TaxID=59823 RepID=UPI00402645BD
MKTYELVERIICNFGFSPTQDQYDALTVFSRFLADRRQEAIMVMRGSAGTGKTSLAAAIVYTLHSLGQRLVLMAPTGRAAKVFSLSSGMQASTIHRAIYREKTFTGIGGSFDLNFNVHRNTLFVVDEASMIGNGSAGESGFGSGSVLYDLMRFVYNGNNCRLMLIGDKAQLPPVGEEEAPALSPQELESYGLTVYQCDLDEVLRQGHDSGILFNATMIRRMITHSEMTRLPKIHVDGFSDITVMPGNELIESLASSYSKMGLDETIVITRSNKRANIYNNGIRNSILDREEAICPGDMLMVVRNKYIPNCDLKDGKEAKETFVANGDRCVVRRVRNFIELYGFHFADATLQFPDFNNQELDTTIILDTLTSEAPALTREQSETLFNAVMEDYADIPIKADRMKALRKDKYFNAIQVKFAYAVTCHKAQGGQWQHVYLDQGYMTDDMLTPDYIHWLYTAFTRAKEKLFLVNWPKTQIDS